MIRISVLATSLYAKYGGFSFVHQLDECFYEQVLQSEYLSGYFAHTNMETLVDHQTHFISSLMGGATLYDDEKLRVAHQNLSIDERTWDEVLDILTSIFIDFAIDADDIKTNSNALLAKKDLFLCPQT